MTLKEKFTPNVKDRLVSLNARVTNEQKEQVLDITEKTNLSQSDVVREALNLCLPRIKEELGIQ